jgi:MFS superfamily sulfate permease-like transporter
VINKSSFKYIKNDLPASIVVFFVALPLCLGIALASGAPLFSGIISGIVGGLIVGMVSGSSLGVSGPAAGLAVIVLTSISSLGSWSTFLLTVFIAGIIQIIMGYLRAGIIAYFFPSSVIKGMLSGIGLLIILKQIPHAIGYDRDPEGDMSFLQMDGENTFTSLLSSFESISPGAILIGVISLLILILWDKVLSKKHKIFQLIQGPIVAIAFGIGMNYLYNKGFYNLTLSSEQIVNIPVPKDISGFLTQFTFPNFAAITNLEVWRIGFIIAIVASLETLLCVEATDKLDPDKNITPTNRELKAQGLGNVVCGLIGGLPVTQVIVRSSANISFGGKTKLSGIFHGFWMLLSALTISGILNMIPLASLAAILLIVGFKLAKPQLFKEMYDLGQEQFVPFVATVVGILSTDLLTGLSIGMAFGIFYTLKHSYNNSHEIKDVVELEDGHEVHHIVLAEEISFLNKAKILKSLNLIPKDSKVIIDYSKSNSISYDVIEVISDFEINAKTKNIVIERINATNTK